MQICLLSPGYFAPIDWFSIYVQFEDILFEREDNYQKQTYRNRQYIYGPNGKMLLNIPIDHAHRRSGAEKYKEVKIENNYDWQRIHWKSLETAYRSSPFFEFYEDELLPLYESKFDYLYDFNLECLAVIKDCLQLDKQERFTEEFLSADQLPNPIKDAREFIRAKRNPAFNLPYYDQVFTEKHGFIPNLSILDLLFNTGPETERILSGN